MPNASPSVSDTGITARDKARALAYFGREASTYHATRVERFPFNWFLGKERNAVLTLSSFVAGARFLDVGCGAGLYARKAKELGMVVTAVDASPDMVAQVKGAVDVAEIADIESLNLAQTFDGIVCAGVLDFVLDPTRAMANLAKHVAPGGWLVILAPRQSLGGKLYQTEKRLHGIGVNLFSRSWLEQQASANGLRVARYVEPLPHNLVIRLEHAT